MFFAYSLFFFTFSAPFAWCEQAPRSQKALYDFLSYSVWYTSSRLSEWLPWGQAVMAPTVRAVNPPGNGQTTHFRNHFVYHIPPCFYIWKKTGDFFLTTSVSIIPSGWLMTIYNVVASYFLVLFKYGICLFACVLLDRDVAQSLYFVKHKPPWNLQCK